MMCYIGYCFDYDCYKFNKTLIDKQIILYTYLLQCKHAEKVGADALLCLPDLFFKPKSEDELIEYLELVGHSAPNTSLFYYHIPSFTQLNRKVYLFYLLLLVNISF